VKTTIGSPFLPDVMFVGRKLRPGIVVERWRFWFFLPIADLDMDEVAAESIGIYSVP